LFVLPTRVVSIATLSVLSVRAFRNTAQRDVRLRPMSSYDEGYQDAVNMFTKMIDDTLANQEVMTTIPAPWILGIMKVSLTNPE
jgi:hypothetical protein